MFFFFCSCFRVGQAREIKSEYFHDMLVDNDKESWHYQQAIHVPHVAGSTDQVHPVAGSVPHVPHVALPAALARCLIFPCCWLDGPCAAGWTCLSPMWLDGPHLALTPLALPPLALLA